MIRLRCLLQVVTRAAKSNQALTSYLTNDLALPVETSAMYCRPISDEVRDIRKVHPLAQKQPLSKKHITSICNVALRREWNSLSAPKHRMLKCVLERARYITIDPKPIVSIRARLRLSSALTPKRRFIYGLIDSDKCDVCRVVGDTTHVLLHCKKFNRERSVCVRKLKELEHPVVFSRELVLGLPPPRPLGVKKFGLREQLTLHDECLFFTGKFIEAIDRRYKL